MSKPLLTYERALEVLVYDPETGALNWRVGRPGAPMAALAGTRTADGYTQVEIDYRLYRAHRVIWLMHDRQVAYTSGRPHQRNAGR